jgi:hypothetical protein
VEKIDGRKCFSCGKFTEIKKKKEGPKIAGEEKVDMLDQGNPGGEKVRLCKDCGEKPTISPKCPYCASCMRKKSIAARAEKAEKAQAANKAPEPGKPKPAVNPQPLIETPPRTGLAVVQVDFGGYPQIFEGLKKLAKEEIRPVELQIIYLLKSHLGRVNDPLRAA